MPCTILHKNAVILESYFALKGGFSSPIIFSDDESPFLNGLNSYKDNDIFQVAFVLEVFCLYGFPHRLELS